MKNKGKFDALTNHEHKIWANKISHVLTGDDVPENVKQILADVFINAANETGIGIDAPELIKISFPLIMSQLNAGNQLGVLHSLQSIVESGIPESVFDGVPPIRNPLFGRNVETLTNLRSIILKAKSKQTRKTLRQIERFFRSELQNQVIIK